MDPSTPTNTADPTPDVVKEARDRMGRIIAYETENRRLANEDVRFLHGNQWPDRIRKEREEEGRPVLTINKLPQYVDQVVGDHRQNRPSVKVRPVDDKSKTHTMQNVAGTKDYETSQVLEGLIRQIEYESRAHIAYDTAFQHEVEHGTGHWRIVTEWENENSFDQVIRIKRIRNSFTVYWDPASEEPDRADANYCFVTQQVPKEEFQRLYPDATTSDMGEGEGDWYDNWYTNDDVKISEYFRVVSVPAQIVLLSDGRVVDAEQFDQVAQTLMVEGIREVKRRDINKRQVEWRKITGNEVLEGPIIFPSQYIPVCSAYGKEIFNDGQAVIRGLVRYAQDAQRMYNYWRTASTELVALAPKAPYLIADDQVEGYEEIWRTANVKNHAYLPYRATDGNAPRRERMPEIPAGAVNEATFADLDIKGTIGLYDPALGRREGEQSGRAILALQQEGDTSTYVFHDNFRRAIEYSGRVLLDMIPRIYDTNRIVRIRNWDESEDFVEINQTVVGPEGQEVNLHDLQMGTYDVVINTGPSYGTQRQEAAEAMLQFMQTVPDSAGLVADLLAESMDWPKADQMAERLRRALPPNLVQQENDNTPPPPPTPQEELAMKELEVRGQEAEAKAMRAQADMRASQAIVAKAEASEIESGAKVAQILDESELDEKVNQKVAIAIADFVANNMGPPEQYAQPPEGPAPGPAAPPAAPPTAGPSGEPLLQ